MKKFTTWLFFMITLLAHADDAPALLKSFLSVGTDVKAEVVMVVPPPQMEQYITKIDAAAKKDLAWFTEFSKNAKAGVPLPYDPRLGITKEEYDAYIELWGKRQFQVIDDVTLTLRKGSDNRWSMVGTNSTAVLTSLRYDEKEDNWKSTNGILQKKEDINADPLSILGAWSGNEWSFIEETSLSKVKENFAIGITADKKFHMLVYRVQEISSTGMRVLDKSIVVRVPVKTAVLAKPNK